MFFKKFAPKNNCILKNSRQKIVDFLIFAPQNTKKLALKKVSIFYASKTVIFSHCALANIILRVFDPVKGFDDDDDMAGDDDEGPCRQNTGMVQELLLRHLGATVV